MTTPQREIRAEFNANSITVYQAFNPAIANAALDAGRFVPPFSLNRMTWIKPSFLWLMERSNWAQKRGQERILAVRMLRSGWHAALAEAVLTSPEPGAHTNARVWERAFKRAPIHVQWDPERSLRGKKLQHRSIQVGISRQRIDTYVHNWVLEIRDETPRVAKIRALLQRGDISKARRFLPRERPYPVSEAIEKRLGIC